MSISKWIVGFLFLSVCITSVFSQEPLWRRGGSFILDSRVGAVGGAVGLNFLNTGVFFDTTYAYQVFDGTLRLYEREKGIYVSPPFSFSGKVIACSQRCRYVITSAGDGIQCYNLEENTSVFIPEKSAVPQLIEEQSDIIVLNNWKIYNLKTGKYVMTLDDDYYQTDLYVRDNFFYCNVSYRNTLRIVNLDDGTYKDHVYSSYLSKFLVSPHRKIVASFGERDHTTEFFEVKGNNLILLRSLSFTHSGCYFIDSLNVILFKKNTQGYSAYFYHIEFDYIIDSLTIRDENADHFSPDMIEDISVERKNDIFQCIITYRTDINCDGGLPKVGGGCAFATFALRNKEKAKHYPNTIFGSSMVFMPQSSTFFQLDNRKCNVIRSEDGRLLSQWTLPPYYFSEIYTSYPSLLLPLTTNECLYTVNNRMYRISIDQKTILDSIVWDSSAITVLRYSSDQSHVILADKRGAVLILDKDGMTLKSRINTGTEIISAALHNDELIFAHKDSPVLYRYDIINNKMRDSVILGESISGIQSDGDIVSGSLFFYNVRTGKKIFAKMEYFLEKRMYKPIDELPMMWNIVHSSTDIFNTKKRITTVKIVGDTVLTLPQFVNPLGCYFDEIIYSQNAKYCFVSGYGVSAMYKSPDISVSVQEKENSISDTETMSLWVMGNTVTLQDNIEYTSCNLYTLEGASLGLCAMTKTVDKITIQLPESISSGIYSLHLYDASSGNVRRVMIGK